MDKTFPTDYIIDTISVSQQLTDNDTTSAVNLTIYLFWIGWFDLIALAIYFVAFIMGLLNTFFIDIILNIETGTISIDYANLTKNLLIITAGIFLTTIILEIAGYFVFDYFMENLLD